MYYIRTLYLTLFRWAQTQIKTAQSIEQLGLLKALVMYIGKQCEQAQTASKATVTTTFLYPHDTIVTCGVEVNH